MNPKETNELIDNLIAIGVEFARTGNFKEFEKDVTIQITTNIK